MSAISSELSSRSRSIFELRVWDGLLFVLGVLGFGILAMANGRDLNWDLLNYHFYNGWAAWTGRVWVNYLPAQLQTFFNPVFDVLQYLAIAHLPARGVAFLIGAVQGTSFYLLFCISRLAGQGAKSAEQWVLNVFAAVAGLAGPVAVSEVGNTMGDLTLAVPVLFGVLKILQSLDAQSRRLTLVRLGGGGVLLGAAAGAKLTMAVYGIAAVVAVTMKPPRRGGRRVAGLWLCGGIALGFLVIAGPWMVDLYHHYGSPVFPLYNGVFHSPYALPRNFHDTRWTINSLSEALLLPITFVHRGIHHMEVPFRSVRYLLLYGSVGLLVLSRIRLSMTCRGGEQGFRSGVSSRMFRTDIWLLWFFVAAYGLWAVVFGYYRYLCPLEMLVPVVVLMALRETINSSKMRVSIFGLGMGAMVGLMSVGSWGRGSWDVGSYFDVQLPEKNLPPHSMVVITSLAPLSFMAPYFGDSVRFVRVESNFDGLESKKYRDLLERAIGEHRGPFELLTAKGSAGRSSTILSNYGLALIIGSCLPVRSATPVQASLCQLKRHK